MALSDAQIAKKVADALNDSRGHTQGRNVVQKAVYSSGSSFTLVLRRRESGEQVEKTVTIS